MQINRVKKTLGILLLVLYILVIVSILPVIGLPYDRFDWQEFSTVYLNFNIYLPVILK